MEFQGVSGHPGRNAYPGQDRITWSGYNPQSTGQFIRVRDTRTGYVVPVRAALWTPARMDELLARRRRRRRRRLRHSEKSKCVF